LGTHYDLKATDKPLTVAPKLGKVNISVPVLMDLLTPEHSAASGLRSKMNGVMAMTNLREAAINGAGKGH
jgi:hypothetical protein